MNHKEMTAHIRRRLSVSGIKASCRKQTICGARIVSVSPPAHNVEFTEDEQRQILLIGKVNGLTLVRGLAIETEGPMVHPHGVDFYIPE